MSVLEPLGIHMAIDFVLIGVILYIAMYELWLWRGVRGNRRQLLSSMLVFSTRNDYNFIGLNLEGSERGTWSIRLGFPYEHEEQIRVQRP